MKSDDFYILEELEKRRGRVTAEAVVEEATDLEHPWHDRFQWDDSEAARLYRITQARALIRSVNYVRRVDTITRRSVAYVRDPNSPADTQGYVSIVRLLSDRDAARAAVLNEFARVASALRRARDLAKILEMDHEIDALMLRVDEVTASLQPAQNTQVEAAATPQ